MSPVGGYCARCREHYSGHRLTHDATRDRCHTCGDHYPDHTAAHDYLSGGH